MKFNLSRILLVTIAVSTYDVTFGMQLLQSERKQFGFTTAQTDSGVKIRNTNSPLDYTSNSSCKIVSSVDVDNASKSLQRKSKNDKENLLVNDDNVNLQLRKLLDEKELEALRKEQLLAKIGILSQNIFVSPYDKPYLIREEASIYDYVNYITGKTMPTSPKKVEGSDEAILLPNFEYCLPLGMGFLHTATCALLLRNTIVDNKIKWLTNNKEICIFDINSIAPINLNPIVSRLTNLIGEFYSSFLRKFQGDCSLILKTLKSNSDLYNYKLLLGQIEEICVSINEHNKDSMYNYIRLCLNEQGNWCFLQKKLNSWIFAIAESVIDHSNILKSEIIKKINENVKPDHAIALVIVPEEQNIGTEKEKQDVQSENVNTILSNERDLNNSSLNKVFNKIFEEVFNYKNQDDFEEDK